MRLSASECRGPARSGGAPACSGLRVSAQILRESAFQLAHHGLRGDVGVELVVLAEHQPSPDDRSVDGVGHVDGEDRVGVAYLALVHHECRDEGLSSIAVHLLTSASQYFIEYGGHHERARELALAGDVLHQRVDAARDGFLQSVGFGRFGFEFREQHRLHAVVEPVLQRVEERAPVGEARVERSHREARSSHNAGDGERLDALRPYLVFGSIQQALK